MPSLSSKPVPLPPAAPAESRMAGAWRWLAIGAVVFWGGFIVMVLEIVGTRFLGKHFGSSFHVWVNQIGLVMVALALGYYFGGLLADRWRKLACLAWVLAPAGIFTFAIPSFADALIAWVATPAGQPLTPFRQTFDPIVGDAVVFLLPCALLATLAPYLTQLAARRLTRVGRASGVVFAVSTTGSIAGVFVSGYFLLQYLSLSLIFHVAGILILALAALCLALNGWLPPPAAASANSPEPS